MPSRALCLLAATLLVACSDTDIVGRLEPLTPATSIELPSDEAIASIGLIGDRTLVMTYRVAHAPPAGWEHDEIHELFAHWLDAELQPSGEPIFLGWTSLPPQALGTRWVEIDGALVAMVAATLDDDGALPNDDELVHVWTIAPGGEPVVEPVDLGVRPTREGGGAWTVGGSTHWAFTEAQLPAVSVGGQFQAVVVGRHDDCWDDVWHGRLFRTVHDGTGWRGRMLETGAEPCDGVASDLVEVPSAVALPDGTLGVLYRSGDSRQGLVRWGRFGLDGTPLAEPRVVGREDPGNGFGNQSPGAAFPNGRVLFAERLSRIPECRRLRLIDADYQQVSDAPWQPACVHEQQRDRFGADVARRQNLYIELLAMGDHAVLATTELPNPAWEGTNEAGGVIAMLLTRDGRRGSDIVLLSGEAERAEGWTRAATSDSRAVVAWFDLGSGRYRARSIHLAPR